MKRIQPGRVLLLAGLLFPQVLYVLLWGRMIASPSDRTGSDFIAFFAAGRVALTHGAANVYDPNLQQAVQAGEVGFELAPGQVLLYNHVPFLIPLLVLLVSQEYVASFVRWCLLLLLLFVLSVALLTAVLRSEGWNGSDRRLTAGALLIFYPFLVCLMNGQDSAFTVLGLAVCVFAFLSGREWLAGLGLALTTIRPQLAVFLALPFLFRKGRTFLWFCAGASLLVLASILILGPAGSRDFVELLLVSAGGEWYGLKEPLMLNLIGLLWRTVPGLGGEWIRWLGWGAYGLGLAGSCLLWLRRRQIGGREIGLLVTLAVFFSPHLHYHDLSLLVIPVFLLLRDLVRQGRLAPRQAVLVPLFASLFLLFSGISEWTRLAAPYLLMAGLVLLFMERGQALLFPKKITRSADEILS